MPTAMPSVQAGGRESHMQQQRTSGALLSVYDVLLSQVPVLRNRKQPFGLSSPWDSFGPETPLDLDYRELR